MRSALRGFLFEEINAVNSCEVGAGIVKSISPALSSRSMR
jgi:hypothetical protein